MFRFSRRLTLRAASLAVLAALLLLASVLAVAPRALAASSVLGSTIVAPSTDTDAIGQAEAFAATATGSASVSTLSVYTDSTSTATTLVAGLYADAGGHPGTLLAQGSLAAPAGGVWDTVTLSQAVNVTSGTTYWLAMLGASGSGNLAFRDHCCGGGGVSQTSSQMNLTALAATWSAGGTWHDGPTSVYAGPLVSPTPTATTGPGTPTPTASPTPTATATPTPGTVIFSDNFAGTTLNPVWTVVQRHGEYAQGETECNTLGAVAVNNGLSITTTAQAATCGDWNLNGSVRGSPSSWPYSTGDVQWGDFAFTYGTVTYRAKFPPQATQTWPAIWLLGQNCQATNIMTADTGYDTCPAFQTAGYVELDLTECFGGTWCQLQEHVAGTNAPACDYPVDNNWHTWSCTWTQTAVSLSMDGQPTGCGFTSAQGSIPSTPMFLLIQTQTGGTAGTPNNAALPATLQVASVTVTQP